MGSGAIRSNCLKYFSRNLKSVDTASATLYFHYQRHNVRHVYVCTRVSENRATERRLYCQHYSANFLYIFNSENNLRSTHSHLFIQYRLIWVNVEK